MLAHLGRAGRAVEADRVDPEGFERCQRGTDLAAEEHRARRLDGHLAEQRRVRPGGGQRAACPDDGGLRLQQVLRGLDEDGVHAAREHAAHLGLVGVAQGGERDVAEGGQLGARADRPDHPARLPVGAAVVRDLAGDAGPGLRQLLDAALDAVLREVAQVGAEGVGLDRVDTGVEVGLVDGPHDVGPGHVEDLVAPLVALEVVQRRVLCLQHRPHGAVGHHHPLGEGLAEGCGGVRHTCAGRHRERVYGRPDDVR
jgi:hypothetical protein